MDSGFDNPADRSTRLRYTHRLLLCVGLYIKRSGTVDDGSRFTSPSTITSDGRCCYRTTTALAIVAVAFVVVVLVFVVAMRTVFVAGDWLPWTFPSSHAKNHRETVPYESDRFRRRTDTFDFSWRSGGGGGGWLTFNLNQIYQI
jgi:fatty acid desaturase